MSKIVYGKSEEIQEYRLGAGGVRLSSRGLAFHTGKVEGTYSQVEVDQLCEKARQEGRRQGNQDAEKRLSEPLQKSLQSVEGVLDEISKFRSELFRESEEEVLSLVRFIAQKILRKEVTLQPELLKELIKKSFEIIEKEKQIVIQLNPADLENFQKAKADFLKSFESSAEIRIASDPHLQVGSALLRTETVQVDIKVETMVNHLLDQVAQSKVNDSEVNEEGDPK